MLACGLAVGRCFPRPCCPLPCWAAVLLIGLAAAGHCGFAANLFTLVSDMMPRQAVGSVVGIGGMAGSLAAVVFAERIGQVLGSGGATRHRSPSLP